ncbi:CTD kinase subunit gamma CTK3-domain-containing protein [Xylariaceae sp. FL1019]|nr:CTD kinase subunit gamma CTK3-domain-containing protein [Xylariaceae sp. FL1019]
MNTRANIMYFIEHLMELASKDRGNTYVHMMQKDILNVVDAVCPKDGSGAANVKVVKKVIQGLRTKYILLDETVADVQDLLKARGTATNDLSLSSPVNNDDTPTAPNSNPKSDASKPSKRQIETRIEEDRERHKRAREHMWIVPSDPLEQARKYFNEISELGEDDRILGEEETAQFRAELRNNVCRHRRTSNARDRPKSRTSNGTAAAGVF